MRGFVKGWLDARDIDTARSTAAGCRSRSPRSAADAETTLLLHGHIDVVPGRPEQFEPRLDGDRLIGRGAYDMKGALAAMLLAVADLRERAGSGSASGSFRTRSPRRTPSGAATCSSPRASSATS